ncbi:MAG: methyltransferase domain-containing protein [Chloroflexi bacterium]|jgi:protein arginine N-methyltransferase 1|nr:methyltransferase domain-containing protein [Chloroflexota bacterium]
MYSISDYGGMMTDSVRSDAYAQALRQAITPDSVVLDLGTGTGIFAVLACRFGARHVYAVEPDNAILVAREVAKVNGYAERIEFIQDISTQVTLPERVDVIISDLRGALSLHGTHIPSIVDARHRFLAPGGLLIPQSDTLWVGLVNAPELYRRYETPWLSNKYELNMRPARDYVINTWKSGRVSAEQLLVTPKCWARIDYYAVEDSNFRAELTWTVTKAGTTHGLIIWFDSVMMEDIGFSNAPGSPNPCTVYGSAFFPLLEPLSLRAGDQVSVRLEVNLVGGVYLWRWQTSLSDQGYPDRERVSFRQSTFNSDPLSLARMHKGASNFVPELNEDGQIKQLALSLMDGHRSLEEISRRVAAQFPERYPNWEDALPRIGKFSGKYSQ